MSNLPLILLHSCSSRCWEAFTYSGRLKQKYIVITYRAELCHESFISLPASGGILCEKSGRPPNTQLISQFNPSHNY